MLSDRRPSAVVYSKTKPRPTAVDHPRLCRSGENPYTFPRFLHARASTLTVVPVGHAIATTDGNVDREADLGPRLAGALQIGKLALAGRKLAVLTGATRHARDAPADVVVGTLAIVRLLHTRATATIATGCARRCAFGNQIP